MASENTIVRTFPDENIVSVVLGNYIAQLSANFCRRGAFTVVLSGERLIHWISSLLQPEIVGPIEWSKWHVFWVDERVVPKTDPLSNYKHAFDDFLSKTKIPPANIYAINDTLDAEGAAEDYEKRIRELVKKNIIRKSPCSRFPEFDLMLLGMGPDGHLASLFPGHPLCKEKKKWVASITDSPKQPPERITFTFPVINSAAYNAMVVCAGPDPTTAEQVAESVAKAINHVGDLPAGSLKAKDELVWYLDEVAASKLPKHHQ